MMSAGKQLEIEREMLLDPGEGLGAPFYFRGPKSAQTHCILFPFRKNSAHEVFIALMVFAYELLSVF